MVANRERKQSAKWEFQEAITWPVAHARGSQPITRTMVLRFAISAANRVFRRDKSAFLRHQRNSAAAFERAAQRTGKTLAAIGGQSDEEPGYPRTAQQN